MAKKEICLMKTKRFNDIRAECSAETSLPDYNTDVRKILHVTATSHPISSFASADGIECSGEVTFEVVYLDFEGAVCSTSFSGDYNFTLKCDTELYKDSLVETVLGGLSLRLMSPRKIAARATLDSVVTVITEETVTTVGDALEPSLSPEINSELISVRTTVITPAVEREYGASLVRFDGKTTDEVSLIHLSVKPVIERIEVLDGEAELLGHIDAVALIKTDEYPLYKLSKSLELSERIPLGDIEEDADLRPSLEVVSATVATEGDEGGVEMMLSVITDTRLVGEKNTAAELYSDMYLCDLPCECTREPLGYDEYLGRWNKVREISENIPLSTLGVGKIREITYADAEVKVTGRELSDNGATLEGEILVSAIGSEMKDGGDVEFVPLKFSVKFKENVNCDCQICHKTAFDSDVRVSNVSVSVDSSSVYLKASLSASASLFCQREVEVLREARVASSEPYPKNPSRVCVYYPEERDTLYTIAKAYHTTKERIIKDNPGVSETFASGDEKSWGLKRLIIT